LDENSQQGRSLLAEKNCMASGSHSSREFAPRNKRNEVKLIGEGGMSAA